MNTKIQSLIDGGFITINDVLEHSGYLENQIDDYYHEQYNMDIDQQEHERMMESQDMYGQEEQELPEHMRSSSPECENCGKWLGKEPQYIIASVSYKMEETYIFEADSEGKILNFGEYGSIAKRFGDLDWTNYYTAVSQTFGEGKYRFDRRIESGNSGVIHMLFKRL